MRPSQPVANIRVCERARVAGCTAVLAWPLQRQRTGIGLYGLFVRIVPAPQSPHSFTAQHARPRDLLARCSGTMPQVGCLAPADRYLRLPGGDYSPIAGRVGAAGSLGVRAGPRV